ncbi:flagellar biosynthesis anti-sigma factor FlgM [Mixta tenebrionis]|uniref:Negative regulator of flagellin synthesis n=1 Tax=Mixta tenebrionis TaxID=2562439 RepID=A0A506V4U3_9GAMM|nr:MULTISPECIES: flagellar biosynthesis anti-sigma factor FlgM [Mixta]QHM77511.1 Negative regulator of flagellin synthesis [Mixta theicola]TPW40678.1 flagellar biosynthesis anti-sigma factor FlgM [Mixta tenebrionis]
MSINHPLKTQPVTPAQLHQEVKLTQRPLADNVSKTSRSPQQNSEVKLSALTQHIKDDTSQDINMERVQQIKQAIRNGELQMDSDKIANALLQHILSE